MRNPLIPAAALLLCVTAASAFAAPGTVLRDEKLYSQPSSTSAVAGSAAKGASVNILTKQGGWLRVTAGKTTGWIRLLSVRVGEGGLGGAGLGDVVGAATTKSDPTRVVAVAGLRGFNDRRLDDESLKQAKFNADELARLDALKVTPGQAKSFASQSGLVAANVAALPKPKPKPEQSSSPWENN
ncbi:MAG: SH3 domain-containing protein [Burkholderiaceae bacterium]|nr:SH3 domain-containing protein [Burkholderiaceae bacterium]